MTQFICQANRLRLLKKPELDELSNNHRQTPVRVPFRVDLRDFSAWLSGKHPYAKPGENPGIAKGRRSLESFLAMQVSWYSGGLNTTQDALRRFFSESHCLIVLDGFDEVAEIDSRNRVVAEVREAYERLEPVAHSLQIIVTSRPAAFATSPGFPEDEWFHLELKDLRRRDIFSYTTKWMHAQNLMPDECSSMSKTLKSKLKQPHLRDLSRNPMQLAILLQLIHIRGASLPDKRTTLYEKYIELFFNREAEKSEIVLEHRDLLILIHGYVAWTLQIQAEGGHSSGSITEADFRQLIKHYLEMEGYESALADILLAGIVERLVVLVSRVQGTYEFEVQPLREYFTARYLYETARYSPVGQERKGTKMDRFEAISKSLYWTNVTRFYCGFYDKGELSSLVDGILHLSEHEHYSLINRPSKLAMMLLSDWVFSQSPRTVKRLMAYLTEEPLFQRLISTGDYFDRPDHLRLPERSGRKELLNACLNKLDSETDSYRRQVLKRIISKNAPIETLKKLWESETMNGRSTAASMRELRDFGLLNEITDKELHSTCRDNVQLRVCLLLQSENHTEIMANKELFAEALKIVSSERLYVGPLSESAETNCLQVLASILIPDIYSEILRNSDRGSGLQFFKELGLLRYFSGVLERTASVHKFPLLEDAIKFTEILLDLLKSDLSEWRKSVTPWGTLVDEGFVRAPRSRKLVMIALISSALKTTSEKGNWSESAWEPTQGLVRRLRFARLKSGNAKWWLKQIDQAKGADANHICLTMCMLWATPLTLKSLRNTLAESLEALSDKRWARVAADFSLVMGAIGLNRNPIKATWFDGLNASASLRFSGLVLARVSNRDNARLVARRLFKDYSGQDTWIIREAVNFEFGRGNRKDMEIDWDYACALSRAACTAGIHWFPTMRRSTVRNVPETVAHSVLNDCDSHCATLVGACENAYGASIARTATKVSDTAISESWFDVSA